LVLASCLLRPTAVHLHLLSFPTRRSSDLGTKYFLICPSLDSIEISRLPRFTPPNVTTPSISVTTAGLEGLRASNNSVTRGRPPVISRVLPVALGIFAKIVPSFIFCPSCTVTSAPSGPSLERNTSPA